MADALILVENLAKSFDSFKAVDDIGFAVSRGEVLGFLGPNGAGKSTTMKMITGFLPPTEGRICVCGYDISEAPLKAQAAIGYLPEGSPAYGEMTVRRFLNFIAEVRGFRGAQKKHVVDQAVAQTELGSVLSQSIETLSKGFNRRVGLAQAILHDPPVLIMDEPTDGLDPNQKHTVRALIKAMAKDKAIVISTHILEEVEAVCTRAMVINRGRIVADGTPQSLAEQSRYHNAVSVVVRAEDAAAVQPVLSSLAEVEGVEETRRNSYVTLTCLSKGAETLIDIVGRAIAANTELDGKIRGLFVEPGRLDEVFRRLTTAAPQDSRGDTVMAGTDPVPKQ